MVVDLADRGDNCRGTAEAALRKVLDLVQIYLALFYLHAQIVLCHVADGTAGDGRKDTAGLRGNQLVVLCDEDHIGSAGLFDLGAGSRIKVYVLVKALLVGVYDGVKAHGIVQAGLYVSGSSRSRTVEVADTDGDRLCAALEVRTYRGNQNTELILLRRLNTDNGRRTENIRTDVERSAAAEGRNPGVIGLYNLFHSLDESSLREHRHLQSLAGILHSLIIEVRTEYNDMSVFRGVGLQSLKAALGILEHTCALIHDNIRVCDQCTLIPLAVLIAGQIAVIGGNVSKSEIRPVKILFLHTYHAPVQEISLPSIIDF